MRTHITTAEHGKFVEILNDSRFPAISTVRIQPTESPLLPPISTVDVYSKFGVITYLANASDINIQLSAGNVNIGNVKLVDDATGSTIYTQITQTGTVGGRPVGSVNVLATNTVAVSAAAPIPVTGTTAVTGNVKVEYADNGSLDAFGKLRVSFPTTLFDSKTLYNKSSFFWSQIATGTGAAVNFTGENIDASVTLSGAGVGAYAVRQTTQRFNYQPGKSQNIIFTGVLAPVSNAIKRYGIFQSLTAAPYTPNVGLYFETQTDAPSSIAVVQLNDGLVPSVSARRELWNIDKLDGTGPSGKVLQLSAANIFSIDYEWLGVGRVRFGFVIDGKLCYCHQINNAGNVQGTYIRTPNLPVRAEIRQVGAGTCNAKMICSTVMSEGGTDFTGVVKSVPASTSPLTLAANTRAAIVGIRLQSTRLDSVNNIINASMMALASNNQSACYRYEIVLNPSISLAGGATGTWAALPNSSFENWQWNNTGTQTITGGTTVVIGFGSVGTSIDLSNLRFEKFLRLGCSIDGIRDELYLVATPLQDNQGIFGSITFVESD